MKQDYAHIASNLANGGVVVLDGGVGTEIQRQGVAMSGEVWCALATREHPDIVRKVHDLFIEAGAEVITANTFATSPLILEAHGLEDEMESLDRQALRIAFDARDAAERPVFVGASMSAMRPIIPGEDRPDTTWSRSEADARDGFRRKAHNLAEAGAELFIMEMMRDTDHALWSIEAASETGLPVWLGISCRRRDEDGALVGYNRPDCPLHDVYDKLVQSKPQAVTIMHSSIDDTDGALEFIRGRYQGPIGAYPEAGYFTIPDWHFDELTPDQFVTRARHWIDSGVQIVGGCCGITPEHIAALAAHVGDLKDA